MTEKNIQLLHIDYDSSNVDNQLYIGDDLIAQDVRQFKMFIQFFNLKLVKEERIESQFCGKYTKRYYERG